MKKVRLRKLCSITAIMLLLAACGGGDDGISGTGFDIKGAAQKGPFETGSTVTANILTDKGEPTSQTITTETNDELGGFSFNVEAATVLQISVDGYHFNEIKGARSDGPLTLRAIYDVSNDAMQNAQVNVLTHLIHNRVLKLIAEGRSATDSIASAQLEFIAAFQSVIPVDDIQDFTHLNLYDINDQFSKGNAYLLALSSIVYQYAMSESRLKNSSVDAELTAVLNYLVNDFANDGQIADLVVLSNLTTSSRLLRPDDIGENLRNKSYQVLNQNLQVAQMDRFIDTDGDGLLNIYDDDIDGDGKLNTIDDSKYGDPVEFNQAEIPNSGIIITYPAKNSEINIADQLVVVDIPDHLDIKIVSLYVDGRKVAEDKDGAPWEINWNACYWGDNNNHSLLVKAETKNGIILRNLDTISVKISDEVKNVLSFSNGISDARLQDTDSFNINYEPIPSASKYIVSYRKSNSEEIDSKEASEANIVIDQLEVATYELKYQVERELEGEVTVIGPWSESIYFEVKAPDLPVTNSPVVSQMDEQYQIELSWSAPNDSSTYVIDVLKDSLVIESVVVESNNYVLMLNAGEYYWRITRKNVFGQESLTSADNRIEAGVFTKRYGGSGPEWADQIIKSNSGGYLIRGSSSSTDLNSTIDSGSDDWIFKIDDNGEMIWQYFSHTSNRERFRDFIELENGDIIAVGYDWNLKQAVVLKINSIGEKLWESLYLPQGSTDRYDFSHIIEWNDSIVISVDQWGKDGCNNCIKIVNNFLHTIDAKSGEISEPIVLPVLEGGDIKSVSDMIVS